MTNYFQSNNINVFHKLKFASYRDTCKSSKRVVGYTNFPYHTSMLKLTQLHPSPDMCHTVSYSACVTHNCTTRPSIHCAAPLVPCPDSVWYWYRTPIDPRDLISHSRYLRIKCTVSPYKHSVCTVHLGSSHTADIALKASRCARAACASMVTDRYLHPTLCKVRLMYLDAPYIYTGASRYII